MYAVVPSTERSYVILLNQIPIGELLELPAGRTAEQGSSHQFHLQCISFRTAALLLYLKILQSQHLHEMIALYSIYQKSLIRN